MLAHFTSMTVTNKIIIHLVLHTNIPPGSRYFPIPNMLAYSKCFRGTNGLAYPATASFTETKVREHLVLLTNNRLKIVSRDKHACLLYLNSYDKDKKF